MSYLSRRMREDGWPPHIRVHIDVDITQLANKIRIARAMLERNPVSRADQLVSYRNRGG